MKAGQNNKYEITKTSGILYSELSNERVVRKCSQKE